LRIAVTRRSPRMNHLAIDCRRRLCVIAAAFCLLLPLMAIADEAPTTQPAEQPVARPANKPGMVTIGAYNVENFFDIYDDPYTLDEETHVKSRAHVERVAKQIRAANPDVMSFEELENEGVLREMIKQFLPDMGYDYVAANKSNGDRGINLGIVSRLPILSMTSHRFLDFGLPGMTESWRYARDFWRVELQAPNNKTLVVFIVHLKSKHDSGTDIGSVHWRLAEATQDHKILAKELAANPNELLAVVGDFNDTPESEPVQTLLKPFSDRVPGLVDAHKDYPKDELYSYVPPKFRSKIDFILCSPALIKRMVTGSAKIFNQPGPNLSGSDHAPITATFDLNN
jgi:endonuclease/exonuclease/phosphatase family metal-dependent hydrolase